MLIAMRFALFCLLLLIGTAHPSLLHAQPHPTKVVEDSIPEVVVTGTGTEHPLKKAPVRTEVITSKMLRSYGGASLEDILSGLCASFDFQASDMGTGIQLGGLGNGYILILLNGKRMSGDVGGQMNLSRIDPTRIERIEIVKGAASALYGSEAIAGVINIITKRSDDRLMIDNTTRIGSYGDVRQFNTFQYGRKKWLSTTGFQLKHSDGWQNTTHENPNRYEKPITNSINKTANAFTDWELNQRLDYEASKATSFYAEGSYYRKRIYRPFGIPDWKTYDLAYNDVTAALGATIKPDNRKHIRLDFSYDRHAYYYDYTQKTTVREFGENGEAIVFPYYPGDRSLQSDQNRLLAQAKGVFHLPAANRLSLGGEWQYDWLEAPNRLERSRVSDHMGGLYLQNEWLPVERWNLTVGARLTAHRSFGTHFTPKISLSYRQGNLTLRAGYSEGFKAPTLKELHYRYISNMSSFVNLHLGNSKLKAETSRYISVGAEWSNAKFFIGLTGYLNRIEHMTTLVTVPLHEAPADYLIAYRPSRVRKYLNMDNARTKGIDLNFKWTPTAALTISGSYAYLDTRANIYDDERQVMRPVTIDGTARHRGTVGILWNKAWESYKLDIGLHGRAQSLRYYQDDGNGKPYMLWRLNTRHRLPSPKHWVWEINAGIDNVLNHYETTYHGLHYGTTTPGRSVYASFLVRFGQKKKSH